MLRKTDRSGRAGFYGGDRISGNVLAQPDNSHGQRATAWRASGEKRLRRHRRKLRGYISGTRKFPLQKKVEASGSGRSPLGHFLLPFHFKPESLQAVITGMQNSQGRWSSPSPVPCHAGALQRRDELDAKLGAVRGCAKTPVSAIETAADRREHFPEGAYHPSPGSGEVVALRHRARCFLLILWPPGGLAVRVRHAVYILFGGGALTPPRWTWPPEQESLAFSIFKNIGSGISFLYTNNSCGARIRPL